MANSIEYIFSLQDKISAKIGNINVTSDRMLGKFADLEKKNLSVNRTFNETGRTMGALREKIALLQAEREWIPAENIEGIRAYNREMKKLNKEINKLESLNGGKFKKWSKEAFSAMPGSNLISNPLVAGAAAIGFAGKSAMTFDEGMAKVNITTQLDESELPDLKKKLKRIARDNKTDILVAPVGFEKINSQLNDVDLSLSILDASLKGSKGGFTDLDTVSGALAQTLSIVGKENTMAMEVLDTFFAAKRVGAGEFADFAKYMPNLIAGASNLGINFKEVAGTFAYMTGKGQSAERAAVLMENAFSVLGRADVRGKMEKAGVNVFDDAGKIRSVVDIFGDLQKVTSSLNDEQKSSLLEKLGLVDKEAKNAFAIMTADIDKLQNSMNEVADSTGETDKALKFSQNTIQKVTGVWNDFKNMGTELGEIILPIINTALDVASIVLKGFSTIVETVNTLFSWWFTQLQTGNPLIWGVTAAIAALSAALLINHARTNAVLLISKAKVIWDGIHAGATWALTTATWALNAAFYASPLGWICLAIGAVVGVIVLCWQKFEGFRRVVYAVWSVITNFGKALADSVVAPFKQVLAGIGKVCSALVSLVKGNFKEAAAQAKEGFKDVGTGFIKGNPLSVTMDATKHADFKGAWEKGLQEGTDSWNKSQKKTNEAELDSLMPQAPAAVTETPQNATYEELMKRLGKNGKVGKREGMLKLDDSIQNYKESSDYTAVTKKLAPVKVDFKPKVQVAETLVPPAAKIIEGRPAFAENVKKADDSKQEYVPGKTNFLQDIMLNVRKIAAVAALPLAINLASPEPAKAQEPVITTVSSPAINMPKTDIPTSEMPEVNVPQPLVAVSSPAINMPKTDVPMPEMPEVNVPKPLVALSSPAVNVPETDIPTPEMPEVNVPQPLVAVSSPAVKMPKTDVPMPKMPEVNVPQPLVSVSSPAVNVPKTDVPTPEMPEVNVPQPLVAVSSPAVNMPEINLPDADMPVIRTPDANVYTVERNEKITESKEIDRQVETGRNVHVDRICENIVIHVANTDRQGTDEIRSEIIRVLDEITMYEA